MQDNVDDRNRSIGSMALAHACQGHIPHIPVGGTSLMNRTLLSTAICGALVAAGIPLAHAAAQTGATAAAQQDQASSQGESGTSQKKNKTKPTTLSSITVTGSLIPQSQVETANPVMTITAQDIKNQGFSNVYQALAASPLASGGVQTSTFSAGFTPQAQTISLLGLSPQYTLYLLNGRPMTDFPLLYNGSANITNISDIPVTMIDHIDVLPGNQSAIYGSSAIAGVINIVLKKHMQGYNLEYRAGGYTDGGGQQQRLAFSGGNTAFNNKFNIMYAVQVDDVHPVWGFNINQTSSVLQSPNPTDRETPFPATIAYVLNGNGTLSSIDPDLIGGCGALSSTFQGSVARLSVPNRGPNGVGNGYECGTNIGQSFSTLLNKSRLASGYVHATYDFNSNTQFFADVLYSWQKQRSQSGPGYSFWAPFFGPPFSANNATLGPELVVNLNQPTPGLDLLEKIFSPEETGGLMANANRTEEDTYDATFGVQGGFGSSNWNYEGYITRSDDRISQHQLHPLTTEVNSFFEKSFLGPELGTTAGFPIYNANLSAFLKPITPAQYNSFSDYIGGSNHTYDQRANFQVNNTDLFNLPAGPVGFAALIEGGNQVWDNLVDPRVIDGDFWGLTGTSGQGSRRQQGAAAEFSVPVFKGKLGSLTADIAGRYDHFANMGGGSDQRKTYKVGLEYRPISTLLLRANVGTAFRAPDMANVFQGPSGFFINGGTDWYKCEKYEPTTPISQCTFAGAGENFGGVTSGNPDLKSIDARSFGYGAVWSPTDKFDLKADYYHISIRNEVDQQNITTLLQTEASCLLGRLDSTSPSCVAAINAVTRGPVTSNVQTTETLESVHVTDINVANEMVRGIIASFDYRFGWRAVGDFTLSGQYNVTLNHTFQPFPGDTNFDLLHNPDAPTPSAESTQFKSIATVDLSWTRGNWAATLEEQRFGATPNNAAQTFGWAGGTGPNQEAGTVAPWIKFNGSVSYHVTHDITTQLIVNNIRNSHPPLDSTAVNWPYYNQFNYDPYGRIVWLDLTIHFPGAHT